jgi:hypothetical protein
VPTSGRAATPVGEPVEPILSSSGETICHIRSLFRCVARSGRSRGCISGTAGAVETKSMKVRALNGFMMIGGQCMGNGCEDVLVVMLNIDAEIRARVDRLAEMERGAVGCPAN